MSLNTNYFPGDGTNQILAKLLLLCGGSPLPGDGINDLLRKLLLAGQAASTGLTVPTNFKDSADGTEAIIYFTSGGVQTEALRVHDNNWIELNCGAGTVSRRIYLSNDSSDLTFIGGTTKNTAAFFEVIGQDQAVSGGNINFTTKNRDDDNLGKFKILNAPADSISSTTRLELFWNGDLRLVPLWTAGATSYTGLKVDVADTASAGSSKVLDCRVDSASVFSVGKEGNTIQATSALTYGATVELDFDLAYNRTVSLTGDIEFTTANLAAGKEVCVKVLADGSDRTLTFPAGWIFLGTMPATIAAGKTGILSLKAYGAADANVVAAWGVEA